MDLQTDPHQFTRDAWEANAENWDACMGDEGNDFFNKSNEPVKILCVFIFCNPFQQLFFQTLPWPIASAGLSMCAREEKKGASRHVPMSKTVGS